MSLEKVKRGCPLCKRMVIGDPEHKYFCKPCNILFDDTDIRTSKVSKNKPRIVREKGFLYFVDKQGDISRVKMARSRSDKGPKIHQKVLKVGVKKEKGNLYYVDKDGYIAKSPMKRGKKTPKGKDVVVQRVVKG